MARIETDISMLLCDSCLPRLEQWLKEDTDELTPDEFLSGLLAYRRSRFDHFFCVRCASMLECMKNPA